MRGKFFSFVALIFAIGVFVWFYFRPPPLRIAHLPDRLSAALTANSPDELENFIQGLPQRHHPHLQHLKNRFSALQKCLFWQKDCQRQAVMQSFVLLKNWSEDFRTEIEVQAFIAPAIYVISRIAHHYQIDESSLENYAKEFSRALLNAFPENPAVIRQAVFIGSRIQPRPPAFHELLAKCLAVESIKGYCQSIQKN